MDPNIIQISNICSNEISAKAFARQNRLLLDQDDTENIQPVGNRCALGTPNCDGEAYLTTVNDRCRNKTFERIQCRSCKKCRSAMNAINNGQVGGSNGQVAADDLRSFFAHIDVQHRNQKKLEVRQSLLIMWSWAKTLSLTQTHAILGDLPGRCNGTLVDWRNYLRQVVTRDLDDAPPMGGPGQVVQIDESMMRGRRKYNRGHLLLGNRHPPARQNYGNRMVGPWVFGITWRRPDGKLEVRMFPVLRRNEATLRAIVLRHVAPDTKIWSDQWAAYNNIPIWGNANYVHRTVNHDQAFINPANGVNTQRMEAMWGHVKTHLLRAMRGTSEILLGGHLAKYRWRLVHQETPFNDLLAEIARQFPLT